MGGRLVGETSRLTLAQGQTFGWPGEFLLLGLLLPEDCDLGALSADLCSWKP